MTKYEMRDVRGVRKMGLKDPTSLSSLLFSDKIRVRTWQPISDRHSTFALPSFSPFVSFVSHKTIPFGHFHLHCNN